jgi:predicted phage terminase large subunit-like protein
MPASDTRQRVDIRPTRINRPLKALTGADKWAPLRNACYTDHELFIREFFKGFFWGELSPMHRMFCEWEREPDRKGVNTVTAAPRGHAKTVFRGLIKPIHAIVYGYRHFIVLIGYSSNEAEGKTGDIRNQLLHNEHLIEVYGSLLDKRAGKTDFVTTNGVRVLARSTGKQVRGLRHGEHRPDYIICDDILDKEGVQTPEQRDKTHTWFFKDLMGAVETQKTSTGQSITCVDVINTCLHQDDLVNKDLLNKPGWERNKFKALLSWATRTDLWDEWKAIYTQLENPNAAEDARAFYEANKAAMDEGTAVLWPGGESYYDLQVYIIQNGLASFYSEKQNDPFDPERQILNPDACERFGVFWPGDAGWPADLRRNDGFVVKRENGQPIHSSQLKSVAFHDPAMADSKKSDYAAICVAATDPHGYIYVLEVYLRRDPPSRQIENAYRLCERWGVEAFYLESVGFQELLRPLYAEEGKKQGKRLPLRSVDQHSNKVKRISKLEPYFSNGWLKLNQKIDPVFMDQLRLFPTTHDDGPDALEGCVAQLKASGGTIQTVNEGRLLR